MDDAITPPQVLNVMSIWCDAGIHLGQSLSGQIRTILDSHLRRTVDTSAGSRVSARLIGFGGRRQTYCVGTVRHQRTSNKFLTRGNVCSGWITRVSQNREVAAFRKQHCL